GIAGIIAPTVSVASDKDALQLTFAAGRISAGRTGKTCLCSVKCHWRFTKTPYNSREPTLQPFNALTFQRSNDSRFNASTLQRFNEPHGAQSHPPFHRHRNLGARGTSSFPAAKSRRARPSCHRPDRVGF